MADLVAYFRGHLPISDEMALKAADHIEALEAALREARQHVSDADVIDMDETAERLKRVDASLAKQLGQSMTINAKLHARIEVFEAALRRIDEWSRSPLPIFYEFVEGVGKIARAALKEGEK